ncbi:hypothetical protein ECE50_008565 [Chitinophaga sp. Mgbs1]|uniref:Uncharacterized protein n=1 Tax=Chitinophaga solisilvae TaxID=1233460 RepID=A0A3S1D617_9BACT|nr:hypothetical protein [Chitinophaga solisilvae]
MKYYVISMLSMLIPSLLKSQEASHTAGIIRNERIITGKLTSEQAGVSVSIKGTAIGTVTNAQGQFRLVIPDSVQVNQLSLVYSSIGFSNQEVSIRRAKFSDDLSAFAAAESSYKNRASAGEYSTAYSLSVPSFNWPPPPPSTQDVAGSQLFMNCTTLGSVNSKLQKSLNSLGYSENSYYSIPGGYALITRLERIREDSPEPYGLPDRWDINIKSNIRTIRDYLASLFTAKKGRFRVIVFAVTDTPVTSGGRSISRDEAMIWLRNGATTLPEEIAAKKFTAAHACSVLIYEFEKKENETPVFISSSPFPGQLHLKAVYTSLQHEN